MAEVLTFPRPAITESHHSGMSTPNSGQSRGNQRGTYSPHNGASGYRGTSSGPVQTYAFKSTPHLKNENRTISSSSNAPQPQPLASDQSSANRQRYPAPSSVSTTSSSSSSNPPSLPPLAKDDTFGFSSFQVPAFSAEANGVANENEAPKPAPDRYRRGHKRAETSGSASGSETPQKQSGLQGVTASGAFGTGKLGQFQYNPQQFAGVNASPKVNSPANDPRPEDQEEVMTSVDKANLPQRYRRRGSGNNFDAGAKTPPGSRSGAAQQQGASAPIPNQHVAQDTRPSSSASTQRPSTTRNEPSPRSFTSADAVRRINNPSPLSRPLSGESTGNGNPPRNVPQNVPRLSSSLSPNPTITQSPAAAAMAALNANEKQDNKNTKSRLRRAFSFGSSAELKRATEGEAAVDRARQRQERFSTELDEEQDAVAKKQEASGLGNSIYSGQGGVFAGSTDNLSISSTASSASLMLRKMGKGMKKGGRSIKGLFRPKSVIGVPAADGPSQPSVGQVSMVTVEAEREQVNVNVDPHDQAGGGTGFPKLERNSVDAARASTPQTNGEKIEPLKDTRRSIVGNEQERQEVLAAVKRGILKRAGTGSPVGSPGVQPVDGTPDVPQFGGIPNLERRGSPAPSTTSSEPRRTGHRRTDSHTLDGDDYFNSVPRLAGNNQSSRSLPVTPRSLNRNISFSPRIQFHDVWSATEYDRRGDIATCNRLTPMLAQQIKEELNTFKMEMEVHEASKPHTHFF